MAEDRFAPGGAPREGWLFPHIFRTFRVALDPKKLLLAAAGILVMSAGWWLISVLAYSIRPQPTLEQVMSPAEYERKYPALSETERKEMRLKAEGDRDREFNRDTDRWLQLHSLAGTGAATVKYQPEEGRTLAPRTVWGGRLRTLPWFEDRGPNPYLMVTAQIPRPWEKDHFWDWVIYDELPVLLEPLFKFFEPIVHLLNPKTGTFTRVYLLLILLWTLATWALFGGAITRMSTVELAGKDPVSITEAVRFVQRRYVSYLLGPIVPIGLVAVLVIVSIVFGFLHMIPFVGDILVSGLFWPFMILIGLGMALLLVGLVGYPMMYPTISAEGSDTLDALSRSYNYVYQSPWSFIWYSLVSLLYGAVVIFFVGFMGSLTVYLGKWAVAQTPGIESANRRPEFLFVYAPTSFGWRQVLVADSPAEDVTVNNGIEQSLRRRGVSDANTENALRAAGRDPVAARERYNAWLDTFRFYNHIGAGMVSFWITLVFLMVLGFGYSFFWTASSMVYLLMRRKVDDIDLDEVYLEETEPSDPFGAGPTTPLPTTSAPAPPASGAGAPQVQETLTVRNDRPPPPATPAPPAEPAPVAEPPTNEPAP